ncbi:MAG: hypothetical protein AMK73_07595 [Planctomycetes bacterium SM23_32]|nr:MAG: hypothetical protein AMK73_07595 [Planctomycetes bacterium SM23_32]
MKKHGWVLQVAAVLVGCSLAAYFVHYLLFRDAHHIFIYLVGDIAFVPLEVLLVAVVIERLLARRERQAMLEKMNMPIGMFFSELGTELLGALTRRVRNRGELLPHLTVGADWSPRDYARARDVVRRFEFGVALERPDLRELRELLGRHRDLLLMLLANPNLLEHESFTDVLWAIFHLMEELTARVSLEELPPSDLAHLAGDVQRVCSRLALAWLRYCEHLQTAYPYIFSILLRTHPLQERPDPIVR